MSSMRWMKGARAGLVALAAAVVLAVPAVGRPTIAAAASFEPGTVHLSGTFRVAVADDFAAGRSQTLYSIDSATGSIQLEISGAGADTLDGALVEVTGRSLADGSVAAAASSIVVKQVAAANPAAVPAFRAAATASPAAVETRKVAVIIADYSDLAGYPATKDQATQTFTSSSASVKSWFETASRGRMTTSTTILGPWHLGIKQCPGGDSSYAFGTSLNAALNAASSHGYDLTTYDHVVLWTKSPCKQDWVGQAYRPGRYVQILMDWTKSTYDEPATTAMVASHELGHNLGLEHANGLACLDGSGHQISLGSGCTIDEYQDQYSNQGMAGSPVHALLDADRLASLGWLGAGESKAVKAVGTYSLVPVYSTASGVRLLTIARPAPVVAGGQSGSWSLELRSTHSGTAWDQFTNSSYPVVATVTTGVTIRYSEDAYSSYGQFGPSYLVDSVADATSKSGIYYWDAPFQPGLTFTDPSGGFTVKVNSVTGSGSSAVASVTIGDTQAPSAPLSMSATAVPTGGAEVDWQAATDNLGLAHYRIYRDGSKVGEVSAATLTYFDPPAGVGGLHSYSVSAVDTAGLVGPVLAEGVTLVGPPSKPLSVTATAGNGAARVAWSAPLQGTPITGYAVTSAPGGFTCTTTGATSCIVSGLANGTPYTFTVTATNLVGTGPASSASNSVTPLPVPGRPTAVAGVPGNASVAVTWTAPADPGSSSINSYRVTSSPLGRTCTTSGTIGCTVTGLANGASYTFSVAASNSLGSGLASASSAGVTPRTHPDAPIKVVALASNGSALVSWGAPPFDGGSPVTAYDVVSTPGGRTCHSGGPRSCTVSGLTNRVGYTFKVTATNVAGPSGPSAASPVAMPLAGATYVPVTPNRIVDSRSGRRLGLPASLRNNIPASFQVTGRSTDPKLNIPAGAVAVTGNLTAVGEGSKGYYSLTPDMPSGTPTTSTLNFPAGDIRANAVTVPLGSGGNLWITFVGAPGKRADVVFDVTGYFVGNTGGATYVPLTPNRVLDSRAGRRTGMAASLSSGVPASFKVTGRSSSSALNVPSNAVAVVGNLTAVGEGSKGYFSLTPARPSGTPATSTINFPAHDTRANAVVVPLGAGGVLWVTFVGTSGTRADVLFDVTGYFVPGTGGATYVALKPNRLVDSRAGRRLGLSASLRSGVPAGYRVTGRSGSAALNVPADAVGVTGNLTAVGAGSAGYYAVTPAKPAQAPTTSTINFPKGDNRANEVMTPPGAGGYLWFTFVGSAGASSDVIFDVSGYFTKS